MTILPARLSEGLKRFPLKGETDNEIYSWRPVGLLHKRQKALADNHAYGVYGAYSHVLCGASRYSSFHTWPIRDARTSFTTATNPCAFAYRIKL